MYTIGKRNQLKFKIRLKREECLTETNLSVCRINIEESEQNKFEYLKNAIISKFKMFGLAEENFAIYWQDSDGEFIIIIDNDDLSLALEELDGPMYELLVCLNATITNGK